MYKEDFDSRDYFITHHLTIMFTITSNVFPVHYFWVSADYDYLISPFQWLSLLLPNSFSNLLHREEVLERIANILVLFLVLIEIQSTVFSKEHSIGF